jgi:hypothetical protein
LWLLQVKSDHIEEMERGKEKSEELHRASGEQVGEGKPIALLTRDRREEASGVEAVVAAAVVVVVVGPGLELFAVAVMVEGWSVVEVAGVK